ncbi:hypothetical protein [Kangiella shandongensis]|uniref:hypothetical protein n=1 Tax=Kangiella shandongensis TaxID=2763258 RepID=UPI001CBC11EB|nr:hypothetical protein [Kangiella shandongensis]
MKESDDLAALSRLWQSKVSEPAPQLAKLTKKYRRQFVLMAINIILETSILCGAGYFFAQSLLGSSSLYMQLWLGFVSSWGLVTYILINRSRWKSIRLLNTRSVNASLTEQINLVRQEIVRWRLSFIATLIFMAVWVILFVARSIFNEQELITTAQVVVTETILMLALVLFKWREYLSKQVLKKISE